MPVFNAESGTIASSIDAIAKTFREGSGRYWISNILPSQDVRNVTVRAYDGHSDNDHKCWANFDILELENGSDVSASICTEAHQSIKLRESVFELLSEMYPLKSDNDSSPPDDEDALEFQDPAGAASASAPSSPEIRGALVRIAQLEKGLTETNSAVRHIHQNMQTTTGNVQVISKRIKGMLANLKATLGYRAKTSFVCTSCQSKGNVAARVKCMHCGQEYWCD